MTFDPRPIERVLSVMLFGVLAMVAATFAFMAFLAGFAVVFDYPLVGLGTWCVTLPVIPVGVVLLVVVMRWTRRGSIGGYVAGLEEALGVEGTLDGASFLFPMVTPEWTGELEGRRVRLRLRRTAGFLSPLSPAGAIGIPWTIQGLVDGDGGPGKVGFAHPKAATLGMGLLGLSNPVATDEVQVFVGERAQIADDEGVMAVAREVPYGPTTLVAVDRGGLSWSDRASNLPPDAMADRLRAVVRLLAAMEDRQGDGA